MNTKTIKIVAAVAVVIIFMIVKCNGNDEKKEVKKTPEELAQLKKDSIESVRIEKLELALTSLKMMVKENMKDPDSYEEIQKAFDEKDTGDIVKLQIKFRGTNSFGGKAVSVAQGTYNFKTDQVLIKEVINL